MLKEKAWGLTLGIFVAACHFVWMILVGLGIAKPAVEWMLNMHSVTLTWDVLPFNWMYAVMLVLMTFVVGFVGGYLFAFVYNKLAK